MLDVFAEMGRWPFDRFPMWYPKATGGNGVPWSVGFRMLDSPTAVSLVSWLLWPAARGPLLRVLRSHPADLVVSFHAMVNYSLWLVLRRRRPRVPYVSVATDLVVAHTFGFAPGADLYIVPTSDAELRGLALGIPPSRLAVLGLPIRREFETAREISRVAVRRKLGLDETTPVVLIVGGGAGIGPMVEAVRELCGRLPAAQIVAITGRNRKLFASLENVVVKAPVSLTLKRFVSDMELWMRAADVFVTKAGANSVTEAYSMGLPMVIYAALPGQEAGNLRHARLGDACIWAPTGSSAAEATLALLSSPDRRDQMSRRSRALSWPGAADAYARRIWDLVYGRP